MAGPGKKQFVPTFYKDDDCWSQSWKLEESTLRTFFCSETWICCQWSTTSTAKPMCPIPIYNLHSPGRHPEEILIQTAIYVTQTLKRHSCWRRDIVIQSHCIAMTAFKKTQIVLARCNQPRLREINKTWKAKQGWFFDDQELITLEGKPPGGFGSLGWGYDTGDEIQNRDTSQFQ
jgi:hypothetical protein